MKSIFTTSKNTNMTSASGDDVRLSYIMGECSPAAALCDRGRRAHKEPKFSSGELVHTVANKNLLIRVKNYRPCPLNCR